MSVDNQQQGAIFDAFRPQSLTRQLPAAPPPGQPARRRSRRRLPSVPDIAIGHNNDEVRAAVRDRVNQSLQLTHLQAKAHEHRFVLQGNSPLPSRRGSTPAGHVVLTAKPGSPNTRLRSLLSHSQPLTTEVDQPMQPSLRRARGVQSRATAPMMAAPVASVELARTALPRFWDHHISDPRCLALDNSLVSHLPEEGAHMTPLLSANQQAPNTFDRSLRDRVAQLYRLQAASIADEAWGWRRKLAKAAMQSLSQVHLSNQHSANLPGRSTASAPLRRRSKPHFAAHKQPSHHSLRERLLLQATHGDAGPLPPPLGRSDSPTYQPPLPHNLSPTSSRLSSPRPRGVEPLSPQTLLAGNSLDWLQDAHFKWELSPKHALLAHLV